ncbi:MAG: class I SAM-dependent methyltransferase [Ekhidna sp.]
MTNNFDSVANFYDRLSSIVFGEEIAKSTQCFLDRIKGNSVVLILGGGTGSLLQHLPECTHIDYVEKSGKMIELAKKRSSQNVNFIHADFLDFETTDKYDFIVCPFFLDCFNESDLRIVLDKISELLCSRGSLLIQDFDVSRTSKLLSFCMHFFFRITTALDSRKLLPIRDIIVSSGFRELEIRALKKGIFSAIYSRGQ